MLQRGREIEKTVPLHWSGKSGLADSIGMDLFGDGICRCPWRYQIHTGAGFNRAKNGWGRCEGEESMTIGLFFIILAVLLAAAMPVGGVFGIMAMLPNLLNPSFSYGATDVARSMFAGMNSFTLLAVPLFIVSGMVMAEGGLSNRLFNFFAYFIGNKTAGFPCAVIVTCMFYDAISGSSPATVSAVGAMTIPFLVEWDITKYLQPRLSQLPVGWGLLFHQVFLILYIRRLPMLHHQNYLLPEFWRG